MPQNLNRLEKQWNSPLEHLKILFLSSVDRTTLAATDLTEALLNTNPVSPFLHIGSSQLVALSKISNLFQYLPKQTGAPPRVVQTSSTSIIIKTSSPRLDTPVPPRVENRITIPYPKVGTTKSLLPTIPFYHTAQCMARVNKPTEPQKTIMITQKEEKNQNELTQLFYGLGVIEGQYRFE